MSDSVQPHRRQPTRLPRPWDSPGKNTGVGGHFLQCMKVKSESEVAQSCPTLSDSMDCSLTGSSVHGIFQARVLELGLITPYCSLQHCYFYPSIYLDYNQSESKKSKKESESHSVMSDSLRSLSPWNSLGRSTGVCSLSLLQGIFPTQGLNRGLPHCRQILYHLSHKGSPRILVAYPFSSGSSRPRNWTKYKSPRKL